MHNPCVCNHVNAAIGRIGKCVPLASEEIATLRLLPVLRELARAVGRHPAVPYSEIYAGLSAKKRAQYERAEQELINRGHKVTRHDAKIKMFVKLEGIKFSEDKVNPDCRAIQFRSKEYTLKLASIIRRAEHAMYSVANVWCAGAHFAKNMNMHQRAEALRQLWEMGFKHVLELDASRFDAHVGVTLLKLEHWYIKQTSYGDQLSEMLSWQLENRGSIRCTTDAGEVRIDYEVKGGRMSGDANTAYGNCILMGSMLTAFGRSLGVRFAFICDGDDSVFFHDGDEATDTKIKEFFRDFGMTMSVENRPKTFETIGFCQARPAHINGRWVMVRDPAKVLSKTTVSHKLNVPRERPSYLRTVALGELSLLRGVPIVQPYLQRLIQVLERKMSLSARKRVNQRALEGNWRLQHWLPSDWKLGKGLPITPESRASFEAAWGYTVEQQLAFEDQIASWTFDVETTVPGQGVDVVKWEYAWLREEM